MKHHNYRFSPSRTGTLRRRAVSTVSSLALASALSFTFAAASSGPALAQDENVLETITVTAQFRKQNLQQTPIAITAVNSEMMDARSQTSIYQVSAQAPNVTLKPQGAAFGPSMGASIRGVGQYDFNPAYEPGVGLYVDDVYYATLTGSIFDLLDLDRVEILRGPQGTLAGRNSIGGAVKLYSKTPEGDGTGNVEATYGSRNRLDLRGSVDFKITDDLFARVSGVAKKQDGYVNRLDYGCVFPESGIPQQKPVGSSDCVMAKEGEVDYNGARAMLRWDNGGPIEVNIIGDFTHDDRTQSATVLTYANFPLDVTTDPATRAAQAAAIDPYTGGATAYDSRFVPPIGSYYNYAGYFSPADATHPDNRADGRTKFEGWGLSGKVDWDLGSNMNLESITAYRSYDSAFSNDDDVSPLAHSLGQGTLTFWSFSQEVRLNGSFGDASQVEWTLGGFYMDQKSVYATHQDLRYAGLSPFFGNDPVTADSKAAFLHVSWAATDKLNLVGGVRYTDESKEYTFSRRNADGTPHALLGALDGVVGPYSGDKVDWRGAIQYQVTDNVMTYAQVATGFKGGGVNPRPFVATQVQPFGQEKLTSYEVGAKTELWDRRIRLNAAAFYSDYKDIQLTANSCPEFSPPIPGFPCALPINAGDAHVKGFEVETSIQPSEGLLVDASVSYLDFTYTYVNPAAGGIDLTDVSPYTPDLKWSFGVQYEAQLGGNNGTLTPRFDASYQGDIFTNASNSSLGKIHSYVLANARLTWRDADDTWEAALEVTNLFDRYYFQTKFDLSGLAGFTSGQPGRPREWAFTVKRNF